MENSVEDATRADGDDQLIEHPDAKREDVSSQVEASALPDAPESKYATEQFDHALVAETMTMLTEGDKSLAIGTAGAHRCIEKEKCMWMQEREDYVSCCAHLKNARAVYAKVLDFAKEKGCESLLHDGDGIFIREPKIVECQKLLDCAREVACVREEADRAGVEAQDICLDLAALPGRWKVWDKPLPAVFFLEELDRARRLCFMSLTAYEKAERLSGAGEADDYERDQAFFALHSQTVWNVCPRHTLTFPYCARPSMS